MSESWYSSWFDSEYYHILYQDRDDAEAQFFLKNLVDRFGIRPGHFVQDLACGKGRHSVFLNSLGIRVLGTDLSENNINYARKFESHTLNFAVHDMRESLFINRFDWVLNLFTSFGYFDDDADNIKILKAVCKSLKPEGVFILDYFNSARIVKNPVRSEIKTIKNIRFEIRRWTDGSLIFKEISFEDQGKNFDFVEKVRLFSLPEFEALFEQCGFQLDEKFGNYQLQSFDSDNSDRLILAGRKKL